MEAVILILWITSAVFTPKAHCWPSGNYCEILCKEE